MAAAAPSSPSSQSPTRLFSATHEPSHSSPPSSHLGGSAAGPAPAESPASSSLEAAQPNVAVASGPEVLGRGGAPTVAVQNPVFVDTVAAKAPASDSIINDVDPAQPLEPLEGLAMLSRSALEALALQLHETAAAGRLQVLRDAEQLSALQQV